MDVDDTDSKFRINVSDSGGVVVGDQYVVSQGFAGPNMNVHDNTIVFHQIWQQAGEGVDFGSLTDQISRARAALKQLPDSDETDVAIGKLVEAKDAAAKKDGSGVVAALRASGQVILEAARLIGADVLVKLIEHQVGIAG